MLWDHAAAHFLQYPACFCVSYGLHLGRVITTFGVRQGMQVTHSCKADGGAWPHQGANANQGPSADDLVMDKHGCMP